MSEYSFGMTTDKTQMPEFRFWHFENFEFFCLNRSAAPQLRRSAGPQVRSSTGPQVRKTLSSAALHFHVGPQLRNSEVHRQLTACSKNSTFMQWERILKTS